MTAADFRRVALSCEGPVAGGWGRMGATHIRLAKADHETLTGALQVAWKLRVDKNARQRVSARSRRPPVAAQARESRPRRRR